MLGVVVVGTINFFFGSVPTAFASLMASDEGSKKAATAAVAAKLATSTSSAQMLTSALSSLVA